MKKFYTITISFALIIFFTFYSFQSQAQVNLFASDNSLSFTGDPGPTTIKMTILNSGAFVSAPTTVSFYFSLDSIPDPETDSLAWSLPVPIIAPGDTVLIDTTFDLCGPDLQNFPSYIFNDSAFYIAFIIDPDNNQEETNEADNSGILLPSLIMGCTLGIEETMISSPLNIYPNPNDGHFTVAYPESWKGRIVATVEDLASHNLVFNSMASDQKDINLSFLAPGIYILRMRCGDAMLVQLVNIQR